jgi:glycosyltransferase involved in cell wall biosynthesis
MRIAHFSTLPPSTSGIADYCAALLPELAHDAEVDLFWDEPTPLSHSFRVYVTRDFERVHARYDAIIYHLGNSAQHGVIYETLLRYPGIVVLHDGTLHHFLVDRTLHRGDAPAYLREMAYAHDAQGYDAAVMIARGAGVYPFYRFPLIRRVVDVSRGVLVHSDTIRRAVLAARPNARVQVIDHFAFPATAPTQSREERLRHLNFPREAFVVSSLGGVGHGKRVKVVLDGFMKFAEQEPRARFIWVGERSPEYDWRRLHLSDKIIFTGRVTDEELSNYLALTDVAVNLRFPTSGEASGAVMRLLAYGKPTLVSHAGWFAELPRAVVVHVAVGDKGNAAEPIRVAEELTRLAQDRAYYSHISAAAREYAAVRTPARAAQEYLEFARTVMNEYVRAA